MRQNCIADQILANNLHFRMRVKINYSMDHFQASMLLEMHSMSLSVVALLYNSNNYIRQCHIVDHNLESMIFGHLQRIGLVELTESRLDKFCLAIDCALILTMIYIRLCLR